MIDVVYDACVLYSAPLRDLLLDLAEVRLVRPHWSNEIHEEWIRNLSHNRPDLAPESFERTRRRMDARFKNSLTKGYESKVQNFVLPDPDDRHVLAVAVHTTSSLIITNDLEGFPNTILQQHGVESVLPDEFILRLIQTEPDRVLQAAKNHRSDLNNPPKTVDEYLETLEEQKLFKTVEFLRQHKDKI
jgi:predicted nucleic acid-binding protein